MYKHMPVFATGIILRNSRWGEQHIAIGQDVATQLVVKNDADGGPPAKRIKSEAPRAITPPPVTQHTRLKVKPESLTPTKRLPNNGTAGLRSPRGQGAHGSVVRATQFGSHDFAVKIFVNADEAKKELAAYSLFPSSIVLEACIDPDNPLHIRIQLAKATLADQIREINAYVTQTQDPRIIKITIGLKLEIAYRLVTCLKVMQEANLVHLDLKPQNIVMGDALTPKLIDLQSGGPLTNVGQNSHFIGTIPYIAPEVLMRQTGPYHPNLEMFTIAQILLPLFIQESNPLDMAKTFPAIKKLRKALATKHYPSQDTSSWSWNKLVQKVTDTDQRKTLQLQYYRLFEQWRIDPSRPEELTLVELLLSGMALNPEARPTSQAVLDDLSKEMHDLLTHVTNEEKDTFTENCITLSRHLITDKPAKAAREAQEKAHLAAKVTTIYTKSTLFISRIAAKADAVDRCTNTPGEFKKSRSL